MESSTHWNDALALDRGAAMAVDELVQLIGRQAREASQLMAMVQVSVPVDGDAPADYDRWIAGVAQERVREALVKARAAAANIETINMVARPLVGDAPRPAILDQLDEATSRMLGHLVQADADLAAVLGESEAAS